MQKVLATQEPEEFKCVVRCGNHPISFEFLLSPLPLSLTENAPESGPESGLESLTESGLESGQGQKTIEPVGSVVGIGRQIVPEVAQLTEVRLTDSSGAVGNSYYALLSKVASNIRKTLDLNTIWQQTVSGLSNMLSLDRCLVCDYSKEMQTIKVVAEHYQSGLHPCLGKTYDLADKSDFFKHA